MSGKLPCAHLVGDEGYHKCQAGRRFPNDCNACTAYQPLFSDDERTPCEVWSRVMGYHRPITAWNIGKQQENKDRRLYSLEHID
jgi:anaerobic ribonucleoside-triphosphate reductase